MKSAIRTLGRIVRATLNRESRVAMLGGLAAYERTPNSICSCCGFRGRFRQAGLHNRPGAACPRCGTLERHRLFKLALDSSFLNFTDKRVLHFAAEKSLSKFLLRSSPSEYVTANIVPNSGDIRLDIEEIDQPDASFDTVICLHVLEHVDDHKALKEIYRILRPGGSLVAMVPMIEGWEESFEDPCVKRPEERELFFGQCDHLRFYGRDFRDRVRNAGFFLAEFTALGRESTIHGLVRGDKVFCAKKPNNDRT